MVEVTEKSVVEKAERLGFQLCKSQYGGFAVADQKSKIVAPVDNWRSFTLAEADAWLSAYITSGGNVTP